MSAGSDADRKVDLKGFPDSSIMDFELLLLSLNVFMILDTNFLLDFFTAPGLQTEHELSDLFAIPVSLLLCRS
jgi:hypothetical protein